MTVLSRACYLAIFCLALFVAQGCVQQIPVQSAELKMFKSGTLKMGSDSTAPKLIYLDINDKDHALPTLAQKLKQNLAHSPYKVVEKPSSAGRIVHITIIGHGTTSPESLEKNVKGGYGAPVKFSGQGAQGILVDALMVKRKVPESSRKKIRHIAQRNALGNTQMRLALLREHGETAAFASDLAREIAAQIKE